MAISKERKEELVTQYQEWMSKSRALILTEYSGLTMQALDDLRRKVREAGGEFHIVKNTLSKIALESSGMPLDEDYFVGSTAMGFAFEDAPGLAKTMSDYAKSTETLRIKGGYVGKELISAERILMLADLPPLPVVRAQLLGTLLSPASQLARLVAEPARQVAQVIKIYADQEASPDAA